MNTAASGAGPEPSGAGANGAVGNMKGPEFERLEPAYPDMVSAIPANQTSPTRLFWLLHGGGWGGSFLLWYLSALAHGKPASYWQISLAVAATGFVVTLGLRWLLHGFWNLPPARLIVAMVLPIVAASTVMGAVYVVAMMGWCGDHCAPSSRLAYAAYMFGHLYVVMTWVGFYIGIKYYRQLQHQTRHALAANAMAHQAQLKMLRYQLNPHFLFNTLNAISTLVLDRDNDTANRMVQSLSAFLRHSLDSDPMQRVTFKQELDALRLYLDIEKVRFAERLQIDYRIEPECYSALLPSLLLQPLIENAIKYAVAKRIEGGRLEIGARREGDMLELRVSDDGPGCALFDHGGMPGGHGVGLVNTQERLRVLYGDRSRFGARNRDPHGVEIVLQLPFEIGGAPRE
jgi:two-component sensor histidine kinase